MSIAIYIHSLFSILVTSLEMTSLHQKQQFNALIIELKKCHRDKIKRTSDELKE